MKTEFAPAERDPMELIKKDFHFVSNSEYVHKLINSLPYLIAIINTKRQVVFANDSLLEILELKRVEESLGGRPGELLHCVNADIEIGGCGTSKNCSACGLVSSILQAQLLNRKIITECRLSTRKNNELVAHDFKVTTSPFAWDGNMYYILSLVDISSEKRKQALQNIFFHDVINKTGSMNGFIDLLKSERDINQVYDFIEFLDILNRDLTNEILAQRDIVAAEEGNLKINEEWINSVDLLHVSVNQMRFHEVAMGKEIVIRPTSETAEFTTDGTLLRRIMMNMIKNSLEATGKGGTVTVGTNIVHGYVRFWVKNEGVIPGHLQMQIFQRSFSTKGTDRGLGTYSMKLIGEQFLKGKVGFTSKPEEGTVFYIDLPVGWDGQMKRMQLDA